MCHCLSLPLLSDEDTVSPADALRGPILCVLFLFGLSYFKASISDGIFLAEPFLGFLPHQRLVEADKVRCSAVHHVVGRCRNCGNFDHFIGNEI